MIQALGADEIRLVAAAVRREGNDRSIVNDMAKGIRKGVPPIRTSIRTTVVEYLPSGLAPWVNKAKVSARVTRSAKSAGVRMSMGRNSGTGKRSDLKRLDSAGRVRHLSWGRPPWSPQTVRAHAISDGITDEGRRQLHGVVVEAAENAAGRILNA